MTRSAELHILVPTHRRAEMLHRLLESLDQQKAELRHATVHVIENGSAVAEELTNSFTSTLPVKYHHLSQGNKSLALNKVVTKLPSDALLVFFDDDVAVRPGTIAAFRKAAQTFGSRHFFGGVLYPDYETPPLPGVIPYLPPSARLVDHSRGKEFRTIRQFTYFMGACWACYRSELDAAGGFNEHFGPGAISGARGQETDAQLRLLRSGITPVFVRDAGVDHHVSARMVTADYAAERIFLASIHRGQTNPSLVHSAAMIVKLVYSTFLLQTVQPNDPGHRYRIAKAAGYFRGLSQTKG